MRTETSRVGKRGTVVIPAKIRRRYQIEEGTIVTVEARRNLLEEAALARLETLLRKVSVHPEPFPGAKPPPGIHLSDKDVPITLAAIHHGATHLLTGDVRHFGEWFGHTVRGVLILRPATYLRRSTSRRLSRLSPRGVGWRDQCTEAVAVPHQALASATVGRGSPRHSPGRTPTY